MVWPLPQVRAGVSQEGKRGADGARRMRRVATWLRVCGGGVGGAPDGRAGRGWAVMR